MRSENGAKNNRRRKVEESLERQDWDEETLSLPCSSKDCVEYEDFSSQQRNDADLSKCFRDKMKVKSSQYL